jgi:hypothetical protein
MDLELIFTGIMPFEAIDSSGWETFRTALCDAEFIE